MKNKNKLYESLEIDFENGAGIIDSLKRINNVPKKDWVKVLNGFKRWELSELGENMEWDRDEMEEVDVKFIEKNKIKWNWME